MKKQVRKRKVINLIFAILFLYVMSFYPIQYSWKQKNVENKIKTAIVDFGEERCNIKIEEVDIDITGHYYNELSWFADTNPSINYIQGDIYLSDGSIILTSFGDWSKDESYILSKRGKFVKSTNHHLRYVYDGLGAPFKTVIFFITGLVGLVVSRIITDIKFGVWR